MICCFPFFIFGMLKYFSKDNIILLMLVPLLSGGEVPPPGGAVSPDIPMSGEKDPAKNSEEKTGKKKYNSLWTQKFGKRKINGKNDLQNVINYIHTNRQKHELPENKKLEKIIGEMCCSVEHAFRTEYKGGFDVVIGNPPYVQIYNYQNYYNKEYDTSASGDLFALFYERGIKLLRKRGSFSYISSSLFIKGLRYKTLRNFLLNNTEIVEILDKGDGVFQNVQMPTAIVVAKKIKVAFQKWNSFIPGGEITSKIEKDTVLLSTISKIKRGLEIGKDKVASYGIGSVKIITGEDVERYGIKNYHGISELVYSEYKKDEEFFCSKRIIIRETGNRITALYVNEDVQQNRSLYSILLKNDISYKFILSVINSALIQFYYKSKFAANTDIFPKIRIAQVKSLPIKLGNKSIQEKLDQSVYDIVNLKSELLNFTKQFVNLLQSKFNIKKLTKKLQNWHELEFGEFLKELKKAKVKLSLSEEAEWMKYFNEQKQKAQGLQAEINRIDHEIDQMVYALYGLTEEEIGIVEESFLK